MLREFLCNLFYEKNSEKNVYADLHFRIFEEFFYILDDELNINIILLYAFPFLRISEEDKSEKFVEILTKLYKTSYFSYNQLFSILFNIFELCSFKIDREIVLNMNKFSYRENLIMIDRIFFNYNRIEIAIKSILENFNINKNNCDEQLIYKDQLEGILKKKKLIGFNEIRDILIDY